MKFIYITIAALFIAVAVNAQNNKNDLLGIWLSNKKNSKMKFYENENQYVGKLVWVDEPKKDVEIGDVIVSDLEYNTKQNIFDNGTFHWGGKKLDCEISLVDKDTIKIKLSKLMFTREIIWRRAE